MDFGGILFTLVEMPSILLQVTSQQMTALDIVMIVTEQRCGEIFLT